MPNPKRKFQNPAPEDVIFGATLNLVDKIFWDAFVKDKTDPIKFPDGFGPFKSQAITWNANKNDATAQRRELENEKSGFEPVVPEEVGVEKEEGRPASSAPLLM
jgi:hypothetical protein